MRIRQIEFYNCVHYNSEYREDIKFFFRFLFNNISNIEKIIYELNHNRKEILYNLIQDNVMKFLSETYILKIDLINMINFNIELLRDISPCKDKTNIIEICKIKIII